MNQEANRLASIDYQAIYMTEDEAKMLAKDGLYMDDDTFKCAFCSFENDGRYTAPEAKCYYFLDKHAREKPFRKCTINRQ